MSEATKHCIRCGETKTIGNFSCYQGKYQAFCQDCRRERDRLNYTKRKNGLAITRYKNYYVVDKRGGFVGTLSRQRAIEIMQLPCHWCGEDKQQIGLDRIRNDAGHTEDNVVPCCEKCNQIRGDIPFAAMELLKDGLVAIREAGLLDDWEPPYKIAYFKNRQRVRHE